MNSTTTQSTPPAVERHSAPKPIDITAPNAIANGMPSSVTHGIAAGISALPVLTDEPIMIAAHPHASSMPTKEARKVTTASTSAFAFMNMVRRGFTVSDVMIDELENSLVSTITPRMPTIRSTLSAPELTAAHRSSLPSGMPSPCDSTNLMSQPIIRLLRAKNTMASTNST